MRNLLAWTQNPSKQKLAAFLFPLFVFSGHWLCRLFVAILLHILHKRQTSYETVKWYLMVSDQTKCLSINLPFCNICTNSFVLAFMISIAEVFSSSRRRRSAKALSQYISDSIGWVVEIAYLLIRLCISRMCWPRRMEGTECDEVLTNGVLQNIYILCNAGNASRGVGIKCCEQLKLIDSNSLSIKSLLVLIGWVKSQWWTLSIKTHVFFIASFFFWGFSFFSPSTFIIY